MTTITNEQIQENAMTTFDIPDIRWTSVTETGAPCAPWRVWFFQGPPFADRNADDCFRGSQFFDSREAAFAAAAAWEAEA